MNVAVRPLVRHLDLFSGIGGFALAAQMVGGIETVGFCEIDPWAQAVLRKNFPGVPIADDVTTLDPKDYGRIDLVSGGYPCQPFSLAGKRKGQSDDRHLWPAMRRIIEDAEPRWVLAENVVGHVSMGLDTVLSELEAMGYACGATVLPACAVDAKHRRDRTWIVANREREGLEGHAGDGTNGNQPGRNGTEAGRPACTGGICQDVPNAENAENAEQVGRRDRPGRWERGAVDADRGGTERALRWNPEPAVGRVANGIPRRVDRLRGLGNAIVPQVGAEILRAMMSVDSLTNREMSDTETAAEQELVPPDA